MIHNDDKFHKKIKEKLTKAPILLIINILKLRNTRQINLDIFFTNFEPLFKKEIFTKFISIRN